MRRYLTAIYLFFIIAVSSNANSAGKDTTLSLLSEYHIFPVIFLDPQECQIMGGSYLLGRNRNDLSLYSSTNFGFSRPVISGKVNQFSWELNFGAAGFSQFDLVRRDDRSFLAGLMNTDFKISSDISIQKDNNLLRIRIFHISSHIGDDFQMRHGDTIVNDKSGNYEQADFTYMRKWGNNYFYAGAGGVYTKYAFRKRLSLQAGGLFNFREKKAVNLFTGADLKIISENGFYPDLRSAFGISFNRKNESIARIWAEYYTGRLPYSTIDYGRVNWLGLALSLSFFHL